MNQERNPVNHEPDDYRSRFRRHVVNNGVKTPYKFLSSFSVRHSETGEALPFQILHEKPNSYCSGRS